MQLRYAMLGRPLVVTGDDGSALTVQPSRARQLLAVLLLHANQWLAPERLCELLGDGHHALGRSSLRAYISMLRHCLLPAPCLRTGPGGYRLDVMDGALDLQRFRSLAARGAGALAAGDHDTAVRLLVGASELWPTAGVPDVHPSPVLQPFLAGLREERMAVLVGLADARLALGEHHTLVSELSSRAAADPLHERTCQQLMLALYRSGRQAHAITAYTRLREALAQEFGCDPSPASRLLHEQILNHDAALADREPRQNYLSFWPDGRRATRTATDAGVLGRLGPELVKVLPLLDERSRRLVLGMAARAAGEGGTARVAAVTGASWQTVANGKAELAVGQALRPGRVRRPGGGRKRLTQADPGLAKALDALIRDACRGDPRLPLVWTTRSARLLAGVLTAAGHPCSDSSVLRLLRQLGYTQQSRSRAHDSERHLERDGQFRYIAGRAREYLDAGDPVISVDSTMKLDTHAVPRETNGRAANATHVNVSTGRKTAALAVQTIRCWWQLTGKNAYPHAARLLVTRRRGGSADYENQAWKAGLAELARETGLDIEVCRFPPGTSKWNHVEHRLFRRINLAWRACPLTSYDVIVATVGAETKG